jgi:A/G-specific adenine glycosylase
MAANVKPTPPAFAHALLKWQRQSGRHDLPWQTAPSDPYRVWVSEIMLQQTQVKTVIPYFHRFMARFPSVDALALASEHDVLALWSGLGYYRRARYLLKCAQAVMQMHGGVFPTTAETLKTLPGIGPSTAAAIASTVFNERVAILDGNVKRVLARLTCAGAPWGSPMLERELLQSATRLLPERSSDMPRYTQAIMDLGALVCTSGTAVRGLSCHSALRCVSASSSECLPRAASKENDPTAPCLLVCVGAPTVCVVGSAVYPGHLAGALAALGA